MEQSERRYTRIFLSLMLGLMVLLLASCNDDSFEHPKPEPVDMKSQLVGYWQSSGQHLMRINEDGSYESYTFSESSQTWTKASADCMRLLVKQGMLCAFNCNVEIDMTCSPFNIVEDYMEWDEKGFRKISAQEFLEQQDKALTRMYD